MAIDWTKPIQFENGERCELLSTHPEGSPKQPIILKVGITEAEVNTILRDLAFESANKALERAAVIATKEIERLGIADGGSVAAKIRGAKLNLTAVS